MAAPDPASLASSATVPKATSCGRCSTTSATRRSAGVSAGPHSVMRPATSIGRPAYAARLLAGTVVPALERVSVPSAAAPLRRWPRLASLARSERTDCRHAHAGFAPPAHPVVRQRQLGRGPPERAGRVVGGQRRPRPRLRDDRWTAAAVGALPRPVRRRLRGAAGVGRHRRQRRWRWPRCSDRRRPWSAPRAPHQRRRDRRARADPRRQADRRARRRTASSGPSRWRPSPTRSASSTTPSRASSRSPSRPSSARSTRPTRSARLADVAHRHGMTVHMDGARIANAAAALGVGRAVVHGRRRRRRDLLRRHEERDDVRRGGRLPRPRAGPVAPGSCASR